MTNLTYLRYKKPRHAMDSDDLCQTEERRSEAAQEKAERQDQTLVRSLADVTAY